MIIRGLADFLRRRRDLITKTVRYNVVHTTTGYSEWTQWQTTKSFDEIETVDFDALMEQIEEFEKQFKEKR